MNTVFFSQYHSFLMNTVFFSQYHSFIAPITKGVLAGNEYHVRNITSTY